MATYSKTGTLISFSEFGSRATEALAVPRLVQWMATFRCGLRCPHCLADANASNSAEMSLTQTQRLIDEVADLGVEEFLITGGEPMARPDLPEVIRLLRRRGVQYSLNTACFPPTGVQAAMEQYPPSFVAVSVDGPPEVHDAFRGRRGAFDEAMEAIRFYRELCGGVAAGTTVTSVSFPCLDSTFLAVVASGATRWGIHLLVSEGRAADRKDLFLSRPQLRRLLEFVAAKRNYFPIQMADEMGYCGDWEPLVRDRPLVCGAGRAQCVILPDGEVVPCTTLDRSCSAGNVLRQPLAEIWRDGFVELRRWRPGGRCIRCRYRWACRGGCWLQRRSGQACYRDVWHVAAAMKTTAGAAVCLGALLAGGTAPASGSPDITSRPIASPATASEPQSGPAWPMEITRGEPDPEALIGGGIEGQIVLWTASSVPQRARRPWPPASVPAPGLELREDPAWKFFTAYRDGTLPRDPAHYAEAVNAALKTQQRSLSFAALLWRSTMERVLADKGPQARSQEQRARLRVTLAEMETAASRWRREIFERKLDPYLQRGRQFPVYFFQLSKAHDPGPAWFELEQNVQRQRWGMPVPPASQEVEDYLARHPFAEHKAIQLRLKKGAEVVLVNARGERRVTDFGAWGIYDIAVIPPGDAGPKLDLVHAPRSLTVVLPANCQITYADLLRLADQQCKDVLEQLERSGYRDQVQEMLPLMQWRYRELQKNPEDPALADTAAWLANFWLF